jgi:RNA polymerase sigma factor (sigma-70 family)
MRPFLPFSPLHSDDIREHGAVEKKTDAELVAQVRLGNKQAFDPLVARYQPLAQRAARSMVGNEELARDLAQEAMLQAYLSLAHLRDGERFRSWLTGIVLNVCRSYLRDQKSEWLSFETLSGGMQLDTARFSGGALSPHEAAEERERHRQVLEAIDALPPVERMVARLFFADQMSLKEVAATAGVSVAAVKNRLYRARKQLREQLLSLYPDLDWVAENGRRRTMIKVNVTGVVEEERPEGRSAAVVLQDEGGQRALRIRMAPSDAGAIDMGLHHLTLPRPMTYSFVSSLLQAAGAKLEEVRIESLQEEVFYAVAKLRRGKTVRELDARPSDALALAVHTGSPIYIAEEIMGQAGMDYPEFLQETQSAWMRDTSIPEVLPLLPVRDKVYFPHMVFPLFVGREKSVRALEEVRAMDRSIIVAAQKETHVDDPQPDDVYHVGIVARVMQLLQLPDRTVRVMLQGIARVRIREYLQTAPFHRARVEVLPEAEDQDAETEALVQEVTDRFQQMVDQAKVSAPLVVGVPPLEAFTRVTKTEGPGRFTDTIAGHLTLPVAAQQQILEAIMPRERLEKLNHLLQAQQ